jgi:hypothetical protein
MYVGVSLEPPLLSRIMERIKESLKRYLSNYAGEFNVFLSGRQGVAVLLFMGE